MRLLPAAVAPTISFALKAGYGLTSSHSPVFLIPFNHPMCYFQLLQPIRPISPFTSSPHPHLPSCHSNELTSLVGRAEKLGESLIWGQHDFFLTLLHGTIAIKNGLPFNSQSFTEGKRWKFSRRKSKYFIYQLWVPYSDSSCLSLYQPKYFWWLHHCLPTFSVLIIFGDQLFSLHKNNTTEMGNEMGALFTWITLTQSQLYWHRNYLQ